MDEKIILPIVHQEITTQELALRWRISPDTLRVWRSIKRGPPYNKRGGSVTYSIVDIEAYEAQNKIMPEA